MLRKKNTYALNENPSTLVKAVVEKDSDTVSFWNIDGGHHFTVSKENFEKDFRIATDEEIHRHYEPKPDKQYVALDDGKGFLAYVPNARWNGWVMPSFPADQALSVLKEMEVFCADDLQFKIKRVDASSETGSTLLPVSEVGYLKPSDIIVIKDLYADEDVSLTELKASTTHGETTWSIGAGSWVWSVVELDEDLLIEHIEFNLDINDYTLTDEIRAQALKLLAEENMDYKEIAKALVEPLGSSHDLLDSDKLSSENGLSM